MSIKASSSARRNSSNSSNSSNPSSSQQIGLNQKQVSQLRGMSGINQSALSSYVSSGSAVGGRNNPRGQGRETATAPVIPSDKVSPVPPLNLPKPNTPADLGNLMGAGNAGLAPGLEGFGKTYNFETGMIDNVPAPATAPSTPQSDLQNYFAGLQMAESNRPSYEQIYSDVMKESGQKRAQQEVNNYQGQLNSIVAKSQADQLRLEGQGRGITDTLIGGQQAQINREAAIAALPVQAQLAAAQGNLQMAQEHVDKMFSIRMQDAQNKYAFQTKIAETLFQYANAEQARKMQDKKDADNRAFSVMQNDQSFARQLAMQAVEFGQTGLAAKLGNLVPSSATYAQDIGALQGQLRKPVAPRAAVKRDTQMVDGKLVDMQTGEVITNLNSTASTDPETIQKSLDQFSFIRSTIKEAQGLTKATGPNMITQGIGNVFIGNTKVKQLANKLDTLKVNLLTLSTDPAVKGFFGPQMSDNDSRLMLAGGTTMDAYSNSEAGLRAELLRYDGLVNRIQTAVTEGQKAQAAGLPLPAPGQNFLTAPNGQLIEIIPE